MNKSIGHAFNPETRRLLGIYGSMLITLPLIVLLLSTMIIGL